MSAGAMRVVQQSVAVETVVKAEQDGRGGRQTKEPMRDTGFVPCHSSSMTRD